jgi:biopolymer transport protein ExbD
MAIQLGASEGDDGVMSTINTTPLVDVMLVLLIIFLITIPAVTTSVAVKLPQQTVEARQTKPDDIVISIDKSGKVYWFDTPLSGKDDLVKRLSKVASQQPQPEVHIRGDMQSTYEGAGRVMYACQLAGISKVAFITEPAGPGS